MFSKHRQSLVKQKVKSTLHPNNRHRLPYDFDLLISTNPKLSVFVYERNKGHLTIDFADPHAVLELNRSLLMHHYSIEYWDIPDRYLCPPIPGRADYIHHVAELLKTDINTIPSHPGIICLDVGVGANAIYPIIARAEYSWSCIGADIDMDALVNVREIIKANKILKNRVEIREQRSSNKIFKGVLSQSEFIDLTICNPPFHSSEKDARKATTRKNNNLSKPDKLLTKQNFGGKAHELWCQGGEMGFVSRMIDESLSFKDNVYWFTSLVSREKHLPVLLKLLDNYGADDVKILPMSQGQKKSRILAWTFLSKNQRSIWQKARWRDE